MKIFRLPIDKLKFCDIIGDKEVRELKIKKFDNIWIMGVNSLRSDTHFLICLKDFLSVFCC